MKEVYIMFYTTLLDNSDVIQNHGYRSPICDLITNINESKYHRYMNFIAPPFSHVKIAFKDKNESDIDEDSFDTYSFKESGFYVKKSAFLSRLGYCVLKLNVDRQQTLKLFNLMNFFVNSGIVRYFSTSKFLMYEAKIRYKLNMMPHAYPDKSDPAWFCSEFVCFALQQIGVFDPSVTHPSYVYPSHIFYMLMKSPSLVKFKDSFNPCFLTNHYKSPDITYNDTNAILVYSKIMSCSGLEAIQKRADEFFSISLCSSFLPMKQIIVPKMIEDHPNPRPHTHPQHVSNQSNMRDVILKLSEANKRRISDHVYFSPSTRVSSNIIKKDVNVRIPVNYGEKSFIMA